MHSLLFIRKNLTCLLDCVFHLAIASLFAISIGCSKKSDSGNSNSAPGPSSMMRGNVIIDPSCGSNSATVTATALNTSVRAYTTTVYNGSTFEVGLIPGDYILAAQAGSCQVQAQVSQTNAMTTMTPYTVCLSLIGNCPGGGGNNGYGNYGYTGGMQCTWGSYGCNGTSYPGTGYAMVMKPNLYFYPDKPVSNFNLKIVYPHPKEDNTLIAIPALGNGSWKGSIDQTGKISIDKLSYDYLYYDSQFNHKRLQNKVGKCMDRNEAIPWMAKYLKNEGFREHSISEFLKWNKQETPPNKRLCIFPQDHKVLNQITTYKTNVEIEARRMWFLIVPEIKTADFQKSKVTTQVADYIVQPNLDAIKEQKKQTAADRLTMVAASEDLKDTKSRQLANNAVVPMEEWGIIFLLEK